MAGLHDVIKATGYASKDLETYLVCLLFCLFDRNGIFLDYLINHTKADGSDLHGALISLFDTLNRAKANRPNNLPEQLAEFPHINGALFKDHLAQCYFDEAARKTLIECARLDWSLISSAIVGSLFQAIMHFDDEAATGKTKKRREFGTHYTSEENILKVIRPLFLDDLYSQFKKCGRNKKDLATFHKYLSELNFFDPACGCGCGKFLVIAYRELRLLELEVIEAIWGNTVSQQLDIDTIILCNVHHFHGIEIDESAAQIATVALWLTDHQINLKVQHFGLYYKRIPLVKKTNIVCANALRIDWAEVLAPEQCSFVMGNPPFVGYSYQSKEQKADLANVFKNMKGGGRVGLGGRLACDCGALYSSQSRIPVVFVSTNSLTQGEQVAILWAELLKLNIKLHFAHRTFRWSNEGKGIAAVHCVIMGFHLSENSSNVGAALAAKAVAKAAPTHKLVPTVSRLFDYGDDIAGEPVEIQAKQINPYLVDAPTVLIEKRRKPLCAGVPEMIYSNKPTDGRHLLLTQEEADAIRKSDPIAAKYIRPFLGAEEFINNLPRYCLWLKDSTAQDRKTSPEILRIMGGVKAMRLANPKLPTKELAETPYLFGEIRQTDQPYLLMLNCSATMSSYLGSRMPLRASPSCVYLLRFLLMLPYGLPYHQISFDRGLVVKSWPKPCDESETLDSLP